MRLELTGELDEGVFQRRALRRQFVQDKTGAQRKLPDLGRGQVGDGYCVFVDDGGVTACGADYRGKILRSRSHHGNRSRAIRHQFRG